MPKKRLQKGRKMVDRESDEDEEGDGGEAERSLRAMMDIDDGAFFYFIFYFLSLFPFASTSFPPRSILGIDRKSVV